jgi:hypothetical protein
VGMLACPVRGILVNIAHVPESLTGKLGHISWRCRSMLLTALRLESRFSPTAVASVSSDDYDCDHNECRDQRKGAIQRF